MSKMGKWLLIFGIAALVSAIAFGVTIAAFGVRDNNYSISINGNDIDLGSGLVFSYGGTTNMGKAGIIFTDGSNSESYDFVKQNEYTAQLDCSGLTDIRLSLASCQADIVCSGSGDGSISYTTGTTPVRFTAEIKDGILDISEKMNVSLFNIGGITPSELTLELPDSLYNALTIELASGSVTTKEMKLDSLNANLASGELDLGLHADKIKLNVASGKANIYNTSDEKAESIDLNAASGSIGITGFGADETKAKLASGKITLDGVSGRVEGDIMSGTLTLKYSEWNSDLAVKLASGKADITLPKGSGASITTEHLSGRTEIDLDGSVSKLTKSSQITAGGSNVHSVDVNAASGTVSIHN